MLHGEKLFPTTPSSDARFYPQLMVPENISQYKSFLCMLFMSGIYHSSERLTNTVPKWKPKYIFLLILLPDVDGLINPLVSQHPILASDP